ncbi:hypothetical protein NDU88_005852 [Pleurodeles waltl]|uniref:Uncharacterized protein n=1 Tax=Pleurodeles waltl TaxID=8319 RepID=A0AAV7LMG9_PLEWA|nr:hypothetical protein NDU88_005852 [Pleurodeles waltl]
MIQHHEQSQSDSRKARTAYKQLQASVRRVAKTCLEIRERITINETCTKVLEAGIAAAVKQSAMRESQISDIQWKLEDSENHQHCNNQQILGIKEEVEGQDMRTYIAKLFKSTFSDLEGWNWDLEIQRAHQFPLYRKKQEEGNIDSHRHPRAILVYFGNYLLR